MHLEILVEEPSAEVALEWLVPRIVPHATFNIHPHGGKSDLLGSLPAKLRAYARWIGDDVRIVVLVDEDRADCDALKQSIVAAARRAGIMDRVLARIAVEELEAWFFGDVPAMIAAYPGVPTTLANRQGFRDPDAIAGGTWEALERILQKAGHMPGGLAKKAAAAAIAQHMSVEENASRSFAVFRDGLRRIA